MAEANKSSQDYWLRKLSVILEDSSGNGIDVGGLNCSFSILKSAASTPNTCQVDILNLNDETRSKLSKKEYSHIELLAGYETNFGMIFSGQIRKVYHQWDSSQNVATIIELGDGDEGFYHAYINKTIAKNATPNDMLDSLMVELKKYDLQLGDIPKDRLTSFNYPRAKTMKGNVRDYLTYIGKTIGCNWTIQDSKVDFIPMDEFKKGEIPDVQFSTGLVEVPIQEDKNSVQIITLLDHRYKINGLLKLTVPEKYGDFNGEYRILSITYSGNNYDSTEWYNRIKAVYVSGKKTQDKGGVH